MTLRTTNKHRAREITSGQECVKRKAEKRLTAAETGSDRDDERGHLFLNAYVS